MHAAADDRRGGAGLGPVEFIALLSMIMALAAVGIDLMLPAFDEMRETFGLAPDSNEVALTVTTYFLGMAAAPLLYGTLADRYGRRPVLWLSGGVYIAGAAASALAPSLGVLLAARFVWGVGAAGGRVVAFAFIRDTQDGRAMARTMSYIMSVFVLVPVIAPTVGAAIVAVGHWRWVFWTGALAAVVVLVWSLRIGETLDPGARRPAGLATIASTARRLVSDRSTRAPLLGLTCMMGVMATYLASSQLVIGEIFGRSDQFPLVFAAVAAVLGVASFLNARLVGRFGIHRLTRPVVVAYLVGGGLTLTVSLAGDGRPGFWVFMPLLTVTIACQMLLTPNLNTLAMAPMADVAGTASAILASISTAGGAALGAVVDSRL